MLNFPAMRKKYLAALQGTGATCNLPGFLVECFCTNFCSKL